MNAGFAYVTAAVLVVAGALLVMLGIRSLRRWKSTFDSSLLAEMSCAEAPKPFQLSAGGKYDVWISGPRFRLVSALVDHEPQVRPALGGAPLPLAGSTARLRLTRGTTSLMRMASFTASAGTYVLGLVPLAQASRRTGLSGISLPLERAVARRLPLPAAAPADCSLQIRDRNGISMDWVFKGVLPLVLGANLLIGGIILVALTPSFL